MAPPRIGREILNQLPPKTIILPDGRKVRPLHDNFDKNAILEEARQVREEIQQRNNAWDKNLNIDFDDDFDRDNWAENIVQTEMLPDYYQEILQTGLQSLYEILKKPSPQKRSNFVLFPATSSPVLSYAVKPILQKVGVNSPFLAFPRTHRTAYPLELDEEDTWNREVAAGKKPAQSARERFLTPPPKPSFPDYPDFTDFTRAHYAYLERKENIQAYLDEKAHVLIDISRAQLDFQIRQMLATWHEHTSLSLDNCRPLIIDDFAETGVSIRDTQRALQRGGVPRKNITAFAFMSYYDEPENWFEKSIHIGQAVYSDRRFPFAEEHPDFPPLTGTFKRQLEVGRDKSAYINIDNLQQPWQEPIRLILSPKSQRNYAALLKALRMKLRSIGEKVAQE